LSERELGESDLASLFSLLPNRCIVLLEDIDSAGIRREKGSKNANSDSDSDSDNEAEKAPKQQKKEEVEKVTEEKKDEIANIEKKASLRRRLTRVLRTPKTDKTDSETTTLVAKDDASETHAVSIAKEPSVKADPSVKAKPSSKAESIDDEGSKSKISLAGLLNIIDGAASNEVCYVFQTH